MKYISNFFSSTSLIGIVYFFSLAFIYSSNINIFNSIKVGCLILIFVAFLIFFIKLIEKRKNLFKMIKEINFELLIFFLFFLLYFVYANIDVFELNKQSCQSLPVFVCKNWSTIYFIYFISLFLIFKEFKDINFSKIIINTGVFFCIIGLFYFFYLILYSQFDIQKYYDLSNKLGVGPEMIRIFPHFSVTYTESSRNYEIFPILIAKLFIIYEIIKSENKKISFKNLLVFSLLSVFVFYSYSRMIWVMDGAIFLSIIILYNNKFKILKLCALNIFIILMFMFLFTYIYNFSKILNWKSNQNIRTNITYYTLARVSTLFSNNLTNYFHKKNENAWYYYTPEKYKLDLVSNNFESEEEKIEFFENEVKNFMSSSFNSNQQRKSIYTEGINKFIEKPLGYGVMSAPVRGSNAESGILQVALEVGIIGLFLFLIILFYPMKLILKSKNTINLTLFTFCVVILISQIFTVYLWYNFLWFYLSLIFGLTNRLETRKEQTI
jgi:hypothetical protein